METKETKAEETKIKEPEESKEPTVDPTAKVEPEPKEKTKKEKKAEKATAKAKVTKEAKPKVAPAPKRIRMLMGLANQDASYSKSQTYVVGKDVSVDTARAWLKSGAAEEVRDHPGPSETK